MEVPEESAKQVRSQKSTFLKLKFQTEEVSACLLAKEVYN